MDRENERVQHRIETKEKMIARMSELLNKAKQNRNQKMRTSILYNIYGLCQ